jgi:hypothetical protein
MDERMIEASTNVDTDYAYNAYLLFCDEIGIPPETQHVFSFRVNKEYPRKRVKKNGQNYYEFQHCRIVTTLEMKLEENKETKETEEEKLKRDKLQKIKDENDRDIEGMIKEVHKHNHQNEDPS